MSGRPEEDARDTQRQVQDAIERPPGGVEEARRSSAVLRARPEEDLQRIADLEPVTSGGSNAYPGER